MITQPKDNFLDKFDGEEFSLDSFDSLLQDNRHQMADCSSDFSSGSPSSFDEDIAPHAGNLAGYCPANVQIYDKPYSVNHSFPSC